MLDIARLPGIYETFKTRYRDRDERMEDIDAVVRGEWDTVDPDEDPVKARSPNLIQVALEDTSEVAGSLPTVRVIPRRPTASGKKKAASMEKLSAGYFDFSQMDLMVPQTVLDLAAFGVGVWVIWPDFEERLPIIEKRDPRTCYPEPGWRPDRSVNRTVFARQIHFSQLPVEHQVALLDFVTDDSGNLTEERLKVTLLEYFDVDEYVLAALVESDGGNAEIQMIPVELERVQNRTGACQVVIGARFSLDGEFRGQFDQIIGTMLAHVRLTSMVLDYADQAVYSDIFVKDLIGEMPYGGGSYIELGPNGMIGRVPPAVTSLNVSDDLDRLVEGIHVGGRWPKSRPGQIDQSIASAKFVEATVGMMNTTIKTYHLILKRMMEHALRLCFLTDQKWFPGEKTISGILRNQEFVEEYDASTDIDVKNRIRVEYGLGLGRDPSTSAVLMVNYAENKYISRDFVQENIEGLTDVERERTRIDLQDLRAMGFTKILQGVEQGTVPNPDRALLEIARRREKGDDLWELYEEFVVKPQEELQEQTFSGFPGEQSPLGASPPELGGVVSGLPAPDGTGLTPPRPPDPTEVLARLNVPAGGGGTFGTQVKR